MATSNLPTPQLQTPGAAASPQPVTLLPLADRGADAGSCCGGGSCSLS
ncbi:hypothetical protein ITJ43_00025 [Microbacterium sp. VKM Ac-2870]|nr:hypothetical protein [Microbacterium sp. VKM Ac-2870]MBF4560528.1 hypothetical protein [Microbacterium sp. VKM Ac-2870]